jgi:hypothetical protein
MKMEQTQCSETLAFKLQTPGNNPEESIQHSQQGKCLQSECCIARYLYTFLALTTQISFFESLSHKGVIYQ